MIHYDLSHTNTVSWEEFDQLVDRLQQDIEAFFSTQSVSIDVVSPLHRSGGVLGSILAVKLRVIPLLPVQIKSSYQPRRLTQVSTLSDLLVDLPEAPTILLCEGNTNSGLTAARAAAVLHEKHPTAKIYLATLAKVFDGPEQIDGIEHIFTGVLTDENFTATPKQLADGSIRPGITIFPWENAEDELVDVNASS